MKDYDYDSMTKEELVKVLSRGLIGYDREGLVTLIKEFIQNSGSQTFKHIPKKNRGPTYIKETLPMNPETGEVVTISKPGVGFWKKPISVTELRNSVIAWVKSEKKSPELDTWLSDQSEKTFGMAVRLAGIDAVRYGDGMRYCVTVPMRYRVISNRTKKG